MSLLANKTVWFGIFALLFILALVPLANAIPETINLHGVLRNSTTGLVLNGTHSINVSYYQTSNDALLYSELISVNVTNGIWNAIIGKSGGLSSSIFDVNSYLVLRINGESSGLHNLSSVPYSFMSGDSEMLGGQLPSYYLDAVTYSGSQGVIISGSGISTNSSYVQRRVSGSCSAGSSIRVVNNDGTVECETDSGNSSAEIFNTVNNDSFYPRNSNPSGYLTGYTETDPVWSAQKNGYINTTNTSWVNSLVDSRVSQAFVKILGFNTTTELKAYFDLLYSPIGAYVSFTDLDNASIIRASNNSWVVGSVLASYPNLDTDSTNDLSTSTVQGLINTNITNHETSFKHGNTSAEIFNTVNNNSFYPRNSNPSGYLTGYTETDPVWTSQKAGFINTSNSSWVVAVISTQYPNLDTDSTNDLLTTTNFGGDVTGTYATLQVIDESHKLHWDNVTNKPSQFYADLWINTTIDARAKVYNDSMTSFVLFVNGTNGAGSGTYDDSWINSSVQNRINSNITSHENNFKHGNTSAEIFNTVNNDSFYPRNSNPSGYLTSYSESDPVWSAQKNGYINTTNTSWVRSQFSAGSNITLTNGVVSVTVSGLKSYFDTVYQALGTYLTLTDLDNASIIRASNNSWVVGSVLASYPNLDTDSTNDLSTSTVQGLINTNITNHETSFKHGNTSAEIFNTVNNNSFYPLNQNPNNYVANGTTFKTPQNGIVTSNASCTVLIIGTNSTLCVE